MLNHDCNPNAEYLNISGCELGLIVRTLRAINPGEEITLNYSGDYFDDEEQCPCRTCQSTPLSTVAGKHAAAAAAAPAWAQDPSPGSSTLLSHPHPFSTSAICKCCPLLSLTTTGISPLDGAREPSQGAALGKRPAPLPLASERTKVTRVRTADSPRQRTLPTSGAHENDGFTVELNTRNTAHI
ncbi:hypothetical protein B0H14DRAFT_3867246 [Mycena olivaceomarginata]|nr:hypothetical protein B0H14DRAFT_3867246 [Mycena olivaceomarginata]